ncbi:MAG: hypothetical protein DRR16_02060 [Candidatus Parabeggiatoa sp. nov. 3]|nr:MAG: hypothetical protein DRR00_06005 [Gammaproteobacteria bacterium]RKZ65176.1 MAG: hypothetical protein DRQ99_13405 [Gammaproteobacteria bacterium]RKZ89628.1 MAG: hypothetical protein DRR16_02060 [Gammaproteobacteria bacterium]
MPVETRCLARSLARSLARKGIAKKQTRFATHRVKLEVHKRNIFNIDSKNVLYDNNSEARWIALKQTRDARHRVSTYNKLDKTDRW